MCYREWLGVFWLKKYLPLTQQSVAPICMLGHQTDILKRTGKVVFNQPILLRGSVLKIHNPLGGREWNAST